MQISFKVWKFHSKLANLEKKQTKPRVSMIALRRFNVAAGYDVLLSLSAT